MISVAQGRQTIKIIVDFSSRFSIPRPIRLTLSFKLPGGSVLRPDWLVMKRRRHLSEPGCFTLRYFASRVAHLLPSSHLSQTVCDSKARPALEFFKERRQNESKPSWATPLAPTFLHSHFCFFEPTVPGRDISKSSPSTKRPPCIEEKPAVVL